MKGIQRASLVWDGYNNYTVEFSTIDGRVKTVENPESVENLITIFEEIFEETKEPIDDLVLRELEVREKEQMIQEKESELIQKEVELLDKENRSIEVIEETKSKIETLLDNETINNFFFLFDKWEPGTKYDLAQKISYDSKVYEVIQAHTSQIDWTPNIAPALFKPITQSGEYQDWRRPTGAHNAYVDGDLVLFEGEIYRATTPWPGYSIAHSPIEMPSYWFSLGTVEEYENPTAPEEPTEPIDPDPEPEVPSEPEPAAGSLENPFIYEAWNGIPYGQEGSKGVYKTGEYVQFPEGVYVSKIDNNTWTPQTNPAGWDIVE